MLTWGPFFLSMFLTARTLQIHEFFFHEFVLRVTFAALRVTAVTLRKALLDAE